MAPMAKVEARRIYRAEESLSGADFEDALMAAADVEETGAMFLHPYEDQLVVAGQGTFGPELLEQVPDVERARSRSGGVVLVLGIASAPGSAPEVRIVGVQAGVGGYTIADGIAVKGPSDFTMLLLEDVLDDIVSVSDEESARRSRRCSIARSRRGRRRRRRRAGPLAGKAGGSGTAIPISGGNIDPTDADSLCGTGSRWVAATSWANAARRPPRGADQVPSLVAEERANLIQSSTIARECLRPSARPKSASR